MLLLASVVVALLLGSAQSAGAPLRLVDEARAKKFDAYCLDGSRPGYYFEEGSSDVGKLDWVLYFPGGGWCSTEEECAERADSPLGSSRLAAPTYDFASTQVSLLSSDKSVNNFFASNKVYVVYCDGSSFSGNSSAKGELRYRGHAVLQAVLEELDEELKMKEAVKVLLHGASAGALSILMHADRIRSEYLLNAVEFEAVVSGGVFLWEKCQKTGEPFFENSMRAMHKLHNAVVHSECAKKNPSDVAKCWNPGELLPLTVTPFFIVESMYDSWMLQNILGFDEACAHNASKCTSEELKFLSHQWAPDMLSALHGAESLQTAGLFLSGCQFHTGLTERGGEWDSYAIGDANLKDMISDWFADQVGLKKHKVWDRCALKVKKFSCHDLTCP